MATFNADAALDLIASEQITMVPGAPAIFLGLLESPNFADTDTSSLRFANTGAANVPVALVERLQTELSFDLVITAFGMTECVVATTCRRGDSDGNDRHHMRAGHRRHRDRHCRPRDGRAPARRHRGRAAAPRLPGDAGYLHDPTATAEAIDADGWLHTGDVAYLDDAGFLFIVDRKADMIVSGGFNVYPREVEHAMTRLEAVAEAIVVGIPDERLRRGRPRRRAPERPRRRRRHRPRAPSAWPTSKCRAKSCSLDALPRPVRQGPEERAEESIVSEEDVITYEVVDHIARITLNRPEYRNAQNSKMTYALDAAFTRATDDDDVAVIVLAGNGKHFCAGHDIGTPGRDVDQTFERKAVIGGRHRQGRRRPALRPRVGGLPRHAPSLEQYVTEPSSRKKKKKKRNC